jgi:cytochrome bd-type quinol oxidase subunit 1
LPAAKGLSVDLDPLLLSRIQFALVVSFPHHLPAFTIGIAAWLATIEGARLVTGDELYRRVFDFWLKVFSVSFGMGVVTGIVMAFQFGTNWGVLSLRMGSIQGPLLGYEGFTAFMLEATFFGVMLFGRNRVSPGAYLFACCMVSLGTMFSSFWILANNSWMQVPVGHRDRRRPHRSGGLVDDHHRTHSARAMAAHAAGRVSDHRHVRDRDRCMVCAATGTPAGITRDAELGSRVGRRVDSVPARRRAI